MFCLLTSFYHSPGSCKSTHDTVYPVLQVLRELPLTVPGGLWSECHLHIFLASWLHTCSTSRWTGMHVTLDAFLLLQALPSRCRGVRRAPGGGGPGLGLRR